MPAQVQMITDYSYITDRLCHCGFQSFIVGGAIRDMLLGRDPVDVDIVTNATPVQIEALFSDRKVATVGSSYGVVVVDGFEVATFREDRYAGLSDKACTVRFAGTVGEDLGRRDLTINAMAFCDRSGEILDPYNGRKDLSRRIIRFVGNPRKRIHKDPNRIVRACRFLAKLDGTFDPDTFEALCECSGYVRDHVAPELLRAEIMKAMTIWRASRFFYALHDIGVLKHIFPGMERCYEHPHGSRHLEDVFDHLMLCGDFMSTRFPLVKLAGYLHDVGKPPEYRMDADTGEFIFHGHASTGSRIVRDELVRLRFTTKEIDFITSLIALHMRTIKGFTPKAARRLLATLAGSRISFRDFLRQKAADRKANLAKRPFEVSELKSMINLFKGEKAGGVFSVRDLPVNGKDVMRVLGISPGPRVGDVLQLLLDRVVDDGPDMNDRNTLLHIISDLSGETLKGR